MESVQKRLDRSLVFAIDVNEGAPLVPNSGPRLQFSSSNPSVADISVDGILFGVAPGTASISVFDGELAESFEVSVGGDPGNAELARLRPHPRIRFTAESLADRKRVLDANHADDLQVFLAEADALLEETAIAYEFEFGGLTYGYSLPYPPEQPDERVQPPGFDDYPFWTRLSRQIEQRIKQLCLAWSLTGDVRFGNRAVEILMGICGWRKWHEYDKATNNLSLPHFTVAAAVAYDELQDLLTSEQRQQVRDAIVRLGLRPMAYWFDREVDHNIATLMNVGMLYGALAIGDETAFVEKYLTKSVAMLAWYVRQRESSNVTEGLVYTSYAMSTLLEAGAALRRSLGRDELLKSTYVERELSAFFAYQFAGSGGFANLSDSQYDVHPRSLMGKLWTELNDPFAGWLLQHEEMSGAGLLDVGPIANRTTTEVIRDVPPDRHFERIDWVAMRSGWVGNDSVAVFVSSPSNAGHNHFDQNHFVLAVRGEWLVTDPGYQNYSPGPEAFFTNDSMGHNALLVNGAGQSVRGHGRVVSSRFDADFATVTGDATAAYEGRVKRWLRTLIFARDRYLLVIDDVAAAKPGDRLSLLFHSTASVLRQGTTLPAGPVDESDPVFTFKGDRASLNLRSWASSRQTISHCSYDGAERFGTWIAYDVSGEANYRVVTLFGWENAEPRFEVRTMVSNGLEILVGDDVHRVEPAGAEGIATSSTIGEGL